MLKRPLLLPLLIALPLSFMACGGEDDDSDGGTPTNEPTPDPTIDNILALTGDSASGDSVFARTCANCHGVDGSGLNSAPDLGEKIPNKTDSQIVNIIVNGTRSMPPLSALSDQEVADVLAYCIETFG